MKQITLTVSCDNESGRYVASWDEPQGNGGITTQAKDLAELQRNAVEAVLCHFGKSAMPRSVNLQLR